jgi:hypothetical protein
MGDLLQHRRRVEAGGIARRHHALQQRAGYRVLPCNPAVARQGRYQSIAVSDELLSQAGIVGEVVACRVQDAAAAEAS